MSMNGMAFWQIFLIGFVLVTTGLVLSWFMLLKVIETSLFLGLVAFGTSLAGMMVGVLGSASYVAQRRREREK